MRIYHWVICCYILCVAQSFAEISEVDKVTGQLRFSKTLANLKGRKLNFPIELKYSSRLLNGQKPSWVGKGFDLDMPYIERTMVGGPDDQPGKSNYRLGASVPEAKRVGVFYNYSPLVQKRLLGTAITYVSNLEGLTGEPNSCVNDDYYINEECEFVRSQTQQDIYRLNNFPAGDVRLFFGGKCGGDDVLKKDSLVVSCSPFRPWKIHYDIADPIVWASNIDKWTIFDENGNKYVFDKQAVVNWSGVGDQWITYIIEDGKTETEHHYTAHDYPYAGSAVWRWYLSKIESYDGDIIHIDYDVIENATKKDDSYLKNFAFKKEGETAVIRLIPEVLVPNSYWYDRSNDNDYLIVELENTDGNMSREIIPLIWKGSYYLAKDYIYEIRKGYEFEITKVSVVLAGDREDFEAECELAYFANSYLVPEGNRASGVLGKRRTYDLLISAPPNVQEVTVGEAEPSTGAEEFNFILRLNVAEPVKFDKTKDYIFLLYSTVYPVRTWHCVPVNVYAIDNYEGYQELFGETYIDINTIEDVRVLYNGRILDMRYTAELPTIYGQPPLGLVFSEGKTTRVELNAYVRDYSLSYSHDLLEEKDLPQSWTCQGVIHHDSKEITSNIVPAAIRSDLQNISFIRSSGTQSNLGRGRLNEIVKTSKDGKVLEKVVFEYALGVPELRLDAIYSIAESDIAESEGRRLYCFSYDGGPTQVLNDGSTGGMITGIEDTYGSTLAFSYQAGSADYLTNNSSCPEVNDWGYRVHNVKVIPGFDGKTIEYMLEYSLPELPYSQAFDTDDASMHSAYSGYSDLHSFLQADAQTESDWTYSANDIRFMPDFQVHYGKVRVSSVTGYTDYNYVTARHSGYEDEPNEYHINNDIRYRIHTKQEYSKTGDLRGATEYSYVIRDHSSRDARLAFLKPATGQILTQKMDVDGEWVYMPYAIHGVPGLLGSASETIVRAATVEVASEKIMVDNVWRAIEYEYDNENGLPTIVTRYKNNPLSEAHVSESHYAYKEYKGTDAAARMQEFNLLAPVSKSLVYYQAPHPSRTRTVVSANINHWGYPEMPYVREIINQTIFPFAQYVWRADSRDANGMPSPAYVNLVPDDYNHLSENQEWQNTNKIVRRSRFGCGEPVQVSLSNGTLEKVFLTRFDKQLRTAEITNADLLECAVYTADYDCALDEDPETALYDWKKNGSTIITPATPLFGKKCLHIQNADGPSKKTLFKGGCEYTISAWVYPLSAGFIPLNISGGGEVVDYQSRSLTANSWQHIEFKLEFQAATDAVASFWRDIVDAGCIGNFYMQDIRIRPSDALAQTFYYDDYDRQICVVDANDKASYAEYDPWGRIVKTRNNSKQIIMEKEYHLMHELMPGKSLQVNYPAGNETFSIGDKITIQWGSNDDNAVVNITCEPGGIPVTANGVSSAGYGSYEWLIPTVAVGESRWIRLSRGSDVVNGKAFTVTAPVHYVNHFEENEAVFTPGPSCENYAFTNGVPGGVVGNCASLTMTQTGKKSFLNVPNPAALGGKKVVVVGYAKIPKDDYVSICLFREYGTNSEWLPITKVTGTGDWQVFEYTADCTGMPIIDNSYFAVQWPPALANTINIDEIHVIVE